MNVTIAQHQDKDACVRNRVELMHMWLLMFASPIEGDVKHRAIGVELPFALWRLVVEGHFMVR